MARYRTRSMEFKRQVAQEFLAGETVHGLAKWHDICPNLIRVWVRNTRPETLTRTLRPPTFVAGAKTILSGKRLTRGARAKDDRS
jgi:transposase-like protein